VAEDIAAATPGTEEIEKVRWRRLIVPVVMVLGVFFCGYAALFVGVKEDLPAPPNASRFPLSITNQNIVQAEFGADTSNLKNLDVAVYVLRDTPQEAATYWHNAFVTNRNWTELATPQPPKDRGNVNFTMVGYNRSASKVILAIAPADQLLALDNEFARALKTANFQAGDTVAVMLAGDIP
jgi:hypothetical protein